VDVAKYREKSREPDSGSSLFPRAFQRHESPTAAIKVLSWSLKAAEVELKIGFRSKPVRQQGSVRHWSSWSAAIAQSCAHMIAQKERFRSDQ
jgi:hypothetical protein